jgi:hypothetical protein
MQAHLKNDSCCYRPAYCAHLHYMTKAANRHTTSLKSKTSDREVIVTQLAIQTALKPKDRMFGVSTSRFFSQPASPLGMQATEPGCRVMECSATVNTGCHVGSCGRKNFVFHDGDPFFGRRHVLKTGASCFCAEALLEP